MIKYKDIHSHLLPMVDDGVKSFDKAISNIKVMVEKGFDEIIVTPHYYEKNIYISNNNEKRILFERLEEEVEKNNLDIKLYLGNEIFLLDNLIKYLDDDKICSLNNSKYLLIEFPTNMYYDFYEDYFQRLIDKGFIPIIAHPERYKFYQEDFSLIYKLRNIGVLFQVNYGSIDGYYGKDIKKFSKKLLKNKVIDFLGTDIHSNSINVERISKISKKIIKIIGKDKFYELSYLNISKVINNEEIN